MNPNTTLSTELSRIFHEPRRLAIMSALCLHPGGLHFTQLKSDCGLTDGNLNRHLNKLEQGGAIRRERDEAAKRKTTLILITPEGQRDFMAYLDALERALHHAVVSVEASSPTNLRPQTAT